jgi:hypothetical protein
MNFMYFVKISINILNNHFFIPLAGLLALYFLADYNLTLFGFDGGLRIASLFITDGSSIYTFAYFSFYIIYYSSLKYNYYYFIFI